MPPFRPVEARYAGPTALGILVPPGARTLVILRPRSLPWDLLPARWDGSCDRPPVFCSLARDEAAQVARQLQNALEHAARTRINPVQTLGDSRGEAFQVWVRTDDYVWVVCHRTLGQAYRPAVFGSRDEARREGEQLARVLWPADDAEQEVYFNTQQFA